MKNVIFKFDGITIQDITEQKRAWMLFSLMEFYKDISQLDFEKYINGHSYKAVLEYIAGRTLSDREVEELAEKQKSIYRSLRLEDTRKASF